MNGRSSPKNHRLPPAQACPPSALIRRLCIARTSESGLSEGVPDGSLVPWPNRKVSHLLDGSDGEPDARHQRPR
jgi:hypothetical protein